MAHLLSVPLTAIWPICLAKGEKKNRGGKKKKRVWGEEEEEG